MEPTTEVLFKELPGNNGNIGLITLNRPAALNALTLPMIHAMHIKLKEWAAADHIKAIVLQPAEGRAFCAGGDIRQTYDRIRAHDSRASIFFRDEYQLNRQIFHYPKPYISFLDGITMGGGVGISIHGSHRVATERLLFAMPETGIGFFPDVGGTYFLPRLPVHMGYLLGLVGTRMASDDCVALGLAHHKVMRDSLPALLKQLADKALGDKPREMVTKIIHEFSVKTMPSIFLEQQAAITPNFSKSTVEDILDSLRLSPNEICQQAANDMMKKSPTSLKITLRALNKGMHLDFDACMHQEYILASHFLKGHDFAEGIRAVVVDKDQKPIWQPSRLDEVTNQVVEAYFRS